MTRLELRRAVMARVLDGNDEHAMDVSEAVDKDEVGWPEGRD